MELMDSEDKKKESHFEGDSDGEGKDGDAKQKYVHNLSL